MTKLLYENFSIAAMHVIPFILNWYFESLNFNWYYWNLTQVLFMICYTCSKNLKAITTLSREILKDVSMVALSRISLEIFEEWVWYCKCEQIQMPKAKYWLFDLNFMQVSVFKDQMSIKISTLGPQEFSQKVEKSGKINSNSRSKHLKNQSFKTKNASDWFSS